ncbi:unnamed protein product [Cylicostephanus goldi]|uniref:Cytochrome c domain-containing protein n=1 Tax=Cylicostephanus goldi TaxID=71465 RepID=A0A3P6T7W7_CYLGO|nr:unnamed protein product [Cylicostephanus goldi]
MDDSEGDYEKGKRLYKLRCLHCHTINTTAEKQGPTLNGIMGRTSGTLPGYTYSDANKNKSIFILAARSVSVDDSARTVAKYRSRPWLIKFCYLNDNVVWTRETMDEYLKNPKKFMPGTKMIYNGLKKAEDRADLIKYIEVESAKPIQ